MTVVFMTVVSVTVELVVKQGCPRPVQPRRLQKAEANAML